MMIAIAQTGWVLTAVAPLPVPVTILALIVLAVGELSAPVLVEKVLGRAPWNAGHIAERFSLLTLITLGEVIAATTAAVATLTGEQGWSVAAVLIAASGLTLAACLWWAYFLVPSRTILERWPDRIFAWRYAHLPVFGAIAAVGAGLRVAADAVEKQNLSMPQIAAALTIPVAVVLVMIFVTWSVLMRSYDLAHIPLLVVSLAPLAAAMIVAVAAGSDPIDLHESPDFTALIWVVVLVAGAGIVEVVGHEIVGYRHTVRALAERGDSPR